jgi:hypothetical protein
MDSKRPDEELLFSLLEGDPRATVILESWRFSLPVTVLPPEEFDALVLRSHTVFELPRPADGDKRTGGYYDTEEIGLSV